MPPADLVSEPSPAPSLPNWHPPNVGTVSGDYIWNGATWIWKTGARLDGYLWDGRQWIIAPPKRQWPKRSLIGLGAIAGVLLLVLASTIALATRSGTGSACQPAAASNVDAISQLLDAYPELGNSLDEASAQELPFDRRAWAATEFRSLVVARLQPRGQVGLWAIAYNEANGAFLGAEPVNSAAGAAAPAAVRARTAETVEVMAQVAASPQARTVLACAEE